MKPIIDEFSKLVDCEIDAILHSQDSQLYKIMSYHIGTPTKQDDSIKHVRKQRIHGSLCLLSCRTLGGNIDLALPNAASIELLTNFCQIHDDVQSGNPQRDNQDAVWWLWGPAQAINAGDGMHALARLSMFRLANLNMSSDKIFQAIQLFDEASLKTCEGRFLELEAQEHLSISVESYLSTAKMKTGSLFECAMKLGALVASDNRKAIDSMGTIGSELGVAMQINAELRELWGPHPDNQPISPEVMNKTKMLPVVYALQKASLSEKRKIGDIYFKRVLEPKDVASLLAILEELDVKNDCEEIIKTKKSECLSELEADGLLPESKNDLTHLINFLLE